MFANERQLPSKGPKNGQHVNMLSLFLCEFQAAKPLRTRRVFAVNTGRAGPVGLNSDDAKSRRTAAALLTSCNDPAPDLKVNRCGHRRGRTKRRVRPMWATRFGE